MLKWCEVSRVKHELHYQFLSEYLTKIGIENELSFYDFPTSEFDEKIEEIKNTHDQIRVGSPYGEILGNTSVISTVSSFTMQSCDCLVFQSGKWWPKSMFAEAFVKSLIKYVKVVDTNSSALIIGVGTTARAAFSGLVKMGYKKFLFAEKFDERATETLKLLRKKFFGLDIRYVTQDELAYLPGASSIVVNTTPYVEDNTMLKDLYYFNYLNKNAIVADVNFLPLDPPLIQQARDLNLITLDGPRLASAVDVEWVFHCFGKEINETEYYEALLNYLKEKVTQT